MNERLARLIGGTVMTITLLGCTSQTIPTASPAPTLVPQTAAPSPSPTIPAPTIPAQWWSAACAVADDFAAMDWLTDANSLPKTHTAVADARKTVDRAQSDSVALTGWAPGDPFVTLVRIALSNYGISLGSLDKFVDSKRVADYNAAISGLTSGNAAFNEAASRLGGLKREYAAPPCQ